MTTTFYFIRRAEPNDDNHDDVTCELTEKGIVAS
ncbi:histidine phosphatase family protein, partial [Streptococcus canis]